MDGLFLYLKRYEKILNNVDLLVALALISTLMLMIIPLPTVIMDLALAISISVSLLILLVSIYTEKSLEFSVFPSLLLMSTLYRLSLNVASTRLILSEGHNGEGSVGSVISAFGHFIVGNNYVIGLIVFIILVIINFVVITKGSGRVAEVAARFTLDAMPGKQMSIDADLNSGLITEKEARERRKEIEEEADFYGSMDGASKFVRGDAIAGIIITVVNIVGGLLVGVLQKDLDIATAAQNYTMLTIGDGLVSQIPALIISTAAGIVVTRSSNKSMSKAMVGQLLVKPKALFILSAIMFLFGLVPGLPFFIFGFISFVVASVAWVISKNNDNNQKEAQEKEEEELRKPQKENIESMLPLDVVELEVGYGLINIVESNEPGDLLERIVSIRKQFAVDLGIIVPSIHLRDNLQLDSGEYQILVKGNKVAGGHLRTDCMLAMDPGNVLKTVEGIPTKEPAFGLDALWVGKAAKDDAELAGYTVVDLPTVMATHLTEIIRSYAHELVGRQEADNLIENFKKNYPKVVDEVIPEKLPFGTVVRVLQNLLKEQVSIRDLLSIFESLADESFKTKDPDALTEAVRKSLARSITSKNMDDEGRVNVLNLSAEMEEAVSNGLLQTEQGIQLVMDPNTAHQLISSISDKIHSHPEIAAAPVLLTNPTSRRHLFKLIHRFIPQLVILSHNELSAEAQVNSVGIVEVDHAS